MTAPTILVVEDNPVTLKMVRVALEAEGYIVVTAESGTATLDLLRRQTPDLIIQDLGLPDIDGMELVARIRALPGGDAIPIIAFTGYLTRLDPERSARAGFTDYVFKPVEPSRLITTVQNHLGGVGSGEAAGAGRRILVADDDPVQRKLLALHLRRRGFVVTTARNGGEALELARRSRPDAIVSDVLMPVMDGFALSLEVRRDAALRAVPVILTSCAFTEEADRRLAASVGANALIMRTPDVDGISDALLAAMGEPAPQVQMTGELPVDDYTRRIQWQLERQLALGTSASQRLAVREAELAVLARFTETAWKTPTVEEMLENLLRRALDAAGATTGAAYLTGPDGRLTLAAHFGYPDTVAAALRDAFGCAELLNLVLESEHAITLPSLKVHEGEAAALLGAAGASAMVIAPFVASQERLGLLLISAPTPNAEWATFVEALAGQIAQAIALTRTFHRLNATERRLADVISASPAVIYVLRPDGTGFIHTWISENVLVLSGYTAEEVLATPDWWLSGLHPDDRDRALAASEELKLRGHVVAEYRFRHKDGTYRWMRDELRVKQGQGSDTEIVGSWVDVTEHKLRDETLRRTEKLATMGQLLAGVAHELNNPLAIVIGQAEMLKLAPESGRVAERAEKLGKAAARCGRIVKNFLGLARQQPPEQGSVALNEVVQEAVELLAYPLRVDDVEVRLDLAEHLPRVWADSHQLHQVLVNLITNAHQAMRASVVPRCLTITTWSELATGRVVLTVADNGPGIAPEIQARIFEPFFTTKPAGQGTGLGLALCQGIIENHGGTITLTSQPGQGAAFRVELPLPNRPEQRGAEPPVEAPGAAGSARILVVDDEPEVAAVLADMLVLDGHKADTVDSGRLALARMAAEPYDVVFCDVRMPGMDGAAVYAEVVRRFPGLASRFVFVTGDTLTQASIPGAAEAVTLTKPFVPDEVRRLVRPLLGGRTIQP